jgi:hypothetical protein
VTGLTGGCLCGALRYAATGAPVFAGLCYCGDCRKASGSAFIGFMGFNPEQITVTGDTRRHSSPAANGNIAVRNFCATCNSLVFGGGHDLGMVNVYAGSLDDPAQFQPAIAIFIRDKAHWTTVPAGLKQFETMPGQDV